MAASKLSTLKENTKKIVLLTVAVCAVVAGLIAWHTSRPYQKTIETKDGRHVTQTGDKESQTISITPENDEEIAASALINDDPQTEIALQAQLQERSKSEEYCSVFEKACFRYPNTWKLTDTSKDDGETVELVSPNGTRVLWQTNVSIADCQPTDSNAYVSTYEGGFPSGEYYSFLTYVGHAAFEYRRLGLIDIDETLTAVGHSVPTLGDVGTCIEHFGPTFPSRQDRSVRIAFRTQGTDILNSDDLPIVKQILLSIDYQ